VLDGDLNFVHAENGEAMLEPYRTFLITPPVTGRERPVGERS
jgi:hypothetical protein